jgi:hypothetical protein
VTIAAFLIVCSVAMLGAMCGQWISRRRERRWRMAAEMWEGAYVHAKAVIDAQDDYIKQLKQRPLIVQVPFTDISH